MLRHLFKTACNHRMGIDMQTLLIKGGTLVSDNRKVDILVQDGAIKCIEPEGCSFSEFNIDKTINAGGLTVFPGFADIHVHFREPGYTEKETIASGSMAAAHGGYTLACPMPNLNPVPDSPDSLQKELDAIAADAAIDVRPYCSITKGRLGKELVDFAALKGRCVAFSDDGSGVQDEQMMRSAMLSAAREDVIIAAHCEDNFLLHGGYIHDGEYCKTHGHKGICSESEWGQIVRDIELCRETGCRYHVCHISTKESVEAIRKAKAEGVRITCETAPHYLTLCEDDLQEDGRFKMNPPLRGKDDRDALVAGLIDGTIDAIATDHAPHTAEQKSRGLEHSAMGVVGLETAFPVLYTHLVKTGIVDMSRLVEVLSSSPRKIFRLPQARISVGSPADLVLIDLNEEYTVNSEEFHSMGHSTPFDGWKLFGKIKYTVFCNNLFEW